MSFDTVTGDCGPQHLNNLFHNPSSLNQRAVQADTSDSPITFNKPPPTLLMPFTSPFRPKNSEYTLLKSILDNNDDEYNIKATVTRTASQKPHHTVPITDGGVVAQPPSASSREHVLLVSNKTTAQMTKPMSGGAKPMNTLSGPITASSNYQLQHRPVGSFLSVNHHKYGRPSSPHKPARLANEGWYTGVTDNTDQTAQNSNTSKPVDRESRNEKPRYGAAQLLHDAYKSNNINLDLDSVGTLGEPKKKRRRRSQSLSQSQSIISLSPTQSQLEITSHTQSSTLAEDGRSHVLPINISNSGNKRRKILTDGIEDELPRTKSMGTIISRMQGPAQSCTSNQDELSDDELSRDIKPTLPKSNRKSMSTTRHRAMTTPNDTWEIREYIGMDHISSKFRAIGQLKWHELDHTVSFRATNTDHESIQHFSLKMLRRITQSTDTAKLRLQFHKGSVSEPMAVHVEFTTCGQAASFLQMLKAQMPTVDISDESPEQMVKIFHTAKENAERRKRDADDKMKKDEQRSAEARLLQDSAAVPTNQHEVRKKPSRISAMQSDNTKQSTEKDPEEFYRSVPPRTVVTRSKRQAESPSPEKSFSGPTWTEMNPDYRNNWKSGSLQWPFQEGVKGKVTVDVDDILRLDDEQFLNDNLIQFYIRYLEHFLENNHPDLRKRVHFMSSFFYSKLTDNMKGGIDYEKVKRWTRTVDVFEKDFIIVPVCQALHWYVMIICNPGKFLPDPAEGQTQSTELSSGIPEDMQAAQQLRREGETADADQDEQGLLKMEDLTLSMSEERSAVPTVHVLGSPLSESEPNNHKTHMDDVPVKADPANTGAKDFVIITLDSLGNKHANVNRHLQSWLLGEADDKRHIKFVPTPTPGANAKNLPDQPNMSDCGVYLLGYLEQFLDNPDVFVRKIRKTDSNVGELFGFDAARARQTIRELITSLRQDQDDLKAKKQTIKASILRGETLHDLADPPARLRVRITTHMKGWPQQEKRCQNKKKEKLEQSRSSLKRSHVESFPRSGDADIPTKPSKPVIEIPESPRLQPETIINESAIDRSMSPDELSIESSSRQGSVARNDSDRRRGLNRPTKTTGRKSEHFSEPDIQHLNTKSRSTFTPSAKKRETHGVSHDRTDQRSSSTILTSPLSHDGTRRNTVERPSNGHLVMPLKSHDHESYQVPTNAVLSLDGADDRAPASSGLPDPTELFEQVFELQRPTPKEMTGTRPEKLRNKLRRSSVDENANYIKVGADQTALSISDEEVSVLPTSTSLARGKVLGEDRRLREKRRLHRKSSSMSAPGISAEAKARLKKRIRDRDNMNSNEATHDTSAVTDHSEGVISWV